MGTKKARGSGRKNKKKGKGGKGAKGGGRVTAKGGNKPVKANGRVTPKGSKSTKAPLMLPGLDRLDMDDLDRLADEFDAQS